MTRPLVAFVLLLFSAIAAAQTVAHSKGAAHTAQVDIAYETLGKPGTSLPVIAVNGGPGLTHAYMVQNDVWERIAGERMVVFYDQRGTGASKPARPGTSPSNGPSQSPAVSQDMPAQVADLEAVRQALGLEKFALVGDSYGGLVAMAYAAAYPQHVAKLVLSDSPGPSWKSIVHLLPEVFPDVQEQTQKEMQSLGPDTDAAARASLRNHFRMIFYSPEKRDAYMSRMGDLGFEPAVSEAVSKATADLDLTPKLAGFHFPVLVINGRYDMNVAPLTAWRLAQAIPGAKAVFFEHSGHLPSYEEPDRYVQVLQDFFNGR
ncbi:MAG TPA: alpha/beta hydrolase [Candidatus Limnocylindrales bacterium]|nr:alpha/beta hydrolase [Candidatus Limnocylindrales bacterium]